MRRFVNDMTPWLPAAALLTVLAAVPPAPAQQPTAPATNPAGARKPARVEEEEEQARPRKPVPKAAEGKDKTSLEDLLAEALKNNPDIRVADAKVQEAEAELNRTRLTVMQKVVTFYAGRKAAQAKVAEAEHRLDRIHKLAASSAISQEEVQLAEQALRTAKAELELVEADMPSLLGKPPQKAAASQADVDMTARKGLEFLLYSQAGQQRQAAISALAQLAVREQDGRAAPGTVAEKVRKALDTPVTVDFQDTPFNDVVEYLQDKTGIVIRNPMTRLTPNDPKITLRFKEPLPLRAVLQAIEDEFSSVPGGGAHFVVREYGLLFVPSNYAPPGAVFVDQLGSSGAPKHPEKPKDKQ